MKYGFIYVLANDAMPGIVKIGMTERAPRARVEELSAATAVPIPFTLELYAEVADPFCVEQRVHEFFRESRVNDGREFFRVDPHDVRLWLQGEAITGWVKPRTIEERRERGAF